MRAVAQCTEGDRFGNGLSDRPGIFHPEEVPEFPRPKLGVTIRSGERYG